MHFVHRHEGLSLLRLPFVIYGVMPLAKKSPCFNAQPMVYNDYVTVLSAELDLQQPPVPNILM